MQDPRHAVKQRHGLASVSPLHAGVMVMVQRFRSDLGLYMHLHCLVADGVFEEFGEGVRFLPADPPTRGPCAPYASEVRRRRRRVGADCA